MKKIVNDELLKYSVIYTFILGFIAHGYCFTNQLASHDALNNIYIAGKWNKASLGRFFYPIYLSWTRGRILLPWLTGIIGLFWVALAVYLIVRMFQLKKKYHVAVVAAICVTNPTVYSLAVTYLHDFDADLFAMFLAVASAYFWNSTIEAKLLKQKIAFGGIGAFLLSVALGIYQSYVSVTITLIMFGCIGMLLKKQNWKTVLNSGIIGILMLGVSAMLYAVEIFVFSNITGISILGNTNYNGLGNKNSVLDGGMVEKIIGAYGDFVNSFIGLNNAYPGRFYLVIHGILALGILCISFYGMKKIQIQNKILFVMLGIMMPFGMNVSYVLSGEMVHDIMRYAFWLIYLLPVLLVDWMSQGQCTNKKLKCVATFVLAGCLLIVITGNVQTSNTIYLKKDFEYQATLSYMTRVAEKIEEHEAYVAGETPVYFCQETELGNSMSGFESFVDITGVESSNPLTFYETYEKHFKYVLNIPLNLYEDDSIKDDDRVAEMSVFPKTGSIQMIDGILVVKLN